MKRFFRLVLAAVAVAGMVSCESSTIEDNLGAHEPAIEQESTKSSYLFATIDNATRVSMTDDGTVAFEWESTDELTIEVGGTPYIYECDDVASGRFVCDNAPEYVEGVEYTAAFGASTPAPSQDNTDFHFEAGESLRLEATFTYDAEADIALSFNGTLPIITIVKDGVSSDDYSGDVVFQNGDETYYAEGSIDGDKLTANIVIKPKSGERNMIFKLKDTNGVPKDTYYVLSSKEYKAGTRYTANVTKLPSYPGDAKIMGDDIFNDFWNMDEEYRNNATWIVTGDEIPAVLNNQLTGNFSNISIVFPNVEEVKESAIQNSSALVSISFPKATKIGASAFINCRSLTDIDCPNVTSIGASAFSGCAVLKSASFPEVTEIGASAFAHDDMLENLDFSKAQKIGTDAFINCDLLSSISFPEVTEVGASAFAECAKLLTVDLPNATSFGIQVFRNCRAVNKVMLTTDSLITGNGEGATLSAFVDCASTADLYLSSVNYAKASGNVWGGCSWKSIKEVAAN